MEYWKECIEDAFFEAEITATSDQIKFVVECIEGAHENFGMYTGSEHIPNPLNSEIDELKMKIKSLESAHEHQLDGIAKGVAQRRNVSANSVNIDNDGHVTYAN